MEEKNRGTADFLQCPDNFFALSLVVENIFQSLDINVAIELRKISRELNRLRADFDAVLAVAATCYAALFH